MIRFDSDRGAAFEPFDLKLTGSPKKCLMIFDDEIWDDYVLPDEALTTFPVSNAYGRVFGTYRYITVDGENVLLVCPTTGSAGAACDMELLIKSGIEKIVAFGTCGRLDHDIAQNTIIVPTAACREEGVSYHYLPDSDEISVDEVTQQIANEVFGGAKLAFMNGKIWTTDAIYRETIGKIAMMRERGCVGVEMELSALLAVAKYRGIKFFEFLIGDDAVGFRSNNSLERDNEKIFNAALEILKRI